MLIQLGPACNAAHGCKGHVLQVAACYYVRMCVAHRGWKHRRAVTPNNTACHGFVMQARRLAHCNFSAQAHWHEIHMSADHFIHDDVRILPILLPFLQCEASEWCAE